MGIDPMTHQPRTDLFASLPQLIALASLKDLMDRYNPLDEHVRLQAEAAQLAKLQYLQYLLQQSTASLTSSNDITDQLDVLALLNSIPHTKEENNPHPTLLNSQEINNTPPAASFSLGLGGSQPLHHPSQLSHLPDPPPVTFNFQTSSLNISDDYQVSQNSDFTTLVSQAADHYNPQPDCSWLNLPSPTPPVIPPTLTETSLSNAGGVAESSFGGGSPYNWPEFGSEDPVMHGIS